MAKKTNKASTRDDQKTADARRLAKVLDGLGMRLPHTKALEAVARLAGSRSRHVAEASSKAVGPIAAPNVTPATRPADDAGRRAVETLLQIGRKARAYAEMGRDYPTTGVGSLIDLVERANDSTPPRSPTPPAEPSQANQRATGAATLRTEGDSVRLRLGMRQLVLKRMDDHVRWSVDHPDGTTPCPTAESDLEGEYALYTALEELFGDEAEDLFEMADEPHAGSDSIHLDWDENDEARVHAFGILTFVASRTEDEAGLHLELRVEYSDGIETMGPGSEDIKSRVLVDELVEGPATPDAPRPASDRTAPPILGKVEGTTTLRTEGDRVSLRVGSHCVAFLRDGDEVLWHVMDTATGKVCRDDDGLTLADRFHVGMATEDMADGDDYVPVDEPHAGYDKIDLVPDAQGVARVMAFGAVAFEVTAGSLPGGTHLRITAMRPDGSEMGGRTIKRLVDEVLPTPEALREARSEAAEAEYQSYGFGDAEVEDHDGFSNDGTEWFRTVYLKPDLARTGGTSPDAPSTKAYFVARFEGTGSRPSEAYAITEKGVTFGARGETEQDGDTSGELLRRRIDASQRLIEASRPTGIAVASHGAWQASSKHAVSGEVRLEKDFRSTSVVRYVAEFMPGTANPRFAYFCVPDGKGGTEAYGAATPETVRHSRPAKKQG